MSATDSEVMFMLGKIHGKLEGIDKRLESQSTTISNIDKRLVAVEKRAALNGAVSGGVLGMGVSILTAAITQAMQTPPG